jgi:dTMP kinase
VTVRKPKGLFLTFEGPDGSGKTTQAKLLAAEFRRRGRKVVLTREPGGTAIGDKIRELILDPSNAEMKSLSELLLYAAGRAQHVEQLIRPALRRGAVVISDRFADASWAYQGAGRGLHKPTIERLNALATGGLVPDATILLSAPAEIGLTRARRKKGMSRGGGDRLERESVAFHRRVAAGYRLLSRKFPRRFIVFPDGLTIRETSRRILEALQRRRIL